MQHPSYSAMSQTRCCWNRELRNSKGIVRWFFFSVSNSWVIDQRVYSLNPLPLSRKKTSCSFCVACICVYVQDQKEPFKLNSAQEKSRWVSWYCLSKGHGRLQRGTGHAQHNITHSLKSLPWEEWDPNSPDCGPWPPPWTQRAEEDKTNEATKDAAALLISLIKAECLLFAITSCFVSVYFQRLL